jgi:putative endonuclease
MSGRIYYVYILTNYTRTVLYTGVTNNLLRRMTEHRERRNGPGCFTARYNVIYLLYYEEFDNIVQAIAREKELKPWHRHRKWALIRSRNPQLLFYNSRTLCLPAPPTAHQDTDSE